MTAPGSPATATARRSDPVAGVIWVTLSMALLALLAAFSRAAMNAGLHPFEVVFLRNLFACILLLPLLAWRGRSLLKSAQFPLYGWRAVISLFSMQAWFYSHWLIPIGEVTAISFLSPVFGTIGAVFLLGERVRLRRWTAVAVGFLGAMVILRPGAIPLGVGQLCAVLAAMTMGVTAILIKQLTAGDDPDKIVFLTNLLLAPLSLIPALFVWRWPTSEALVPLLGLGVCAVLGHVTLVRGYAAIDASLAMTFEFSRLPFAVAIAYVAFNETIDLWTWIGALVIFASAVYITRRETRAAPGSRSPQSFPSNSATK